MKKIFKIIIGLSVLATFGGFITRQLGISYENSQIIKNIVFFLAFYFIVRNVKDIQINSKRTKSISKLASSSSWNILNPTGFLIKMTLKNPKLLEQLISPESKNKKQILKLALIGSLGATIIILTAFFSLKHLLYFLLQI